MAVFVSFNVIKKQEILNNAGFKPIEPETTTTVFVNPDNVEGIKDTDESGVSMIELVSGQKYLINDSVNNIKTTLESA